MLTKHHTPDTITADFQSRTGTGISTIVACIGHTDFTKNHNILDKTYK
jgi:hypothetical protein